MKIDNDGYIVEWGDYDYLPEGMVVIPDGQFVSGSHFKKKWINGRVTETDEHIAGNPSVEMMRHVQYPAVGDQLGAIWKAIAPLIDHPEAADILAKIQAVKDANPKA